jgi:hypothetical protein
MLGALVSYLQEEVSEEPKKRKMKPILMEVRKKMPIRMEARKKPLLIMMKIHRPMTLWSSRKIRSCPPVLLAQLCLLLRLSGPKELLGPLESRTK